MAKTIKLSAQKREVFGRKVKQLRAQNLLPANIYGKKTKSIAVTLNKSDFSKVYSEAGETGLIDLTLNSESKSRHVLISNIQVNPVTDIILHVDLRQVELTEKVTATVPVEVVGTAPAVTDKDGVLLLAYNELQVEALPANLPDAIEVDVSGLKEIGDAILAKDLKIDRDKLTLEVDEDAVIVNIQSQAEEEVEVETPAEAEVEGEAEAEAKDEDKSGEAEGDQPADKKSDKE
jgi:large subunit ribosomal protein L25